MYNGAWEAQYESQIYLCKTFSSSLNVTREITRFSKSRIPHQPGNHKFVC